MALSFNVSDFSRFAGSPGFTQGDSDTLYGADPAGFQYTGANDYGQLKS